MSEDSALTLVWLLSLDGTGETSVEWAYLPADTSLEAGFMLSGWLLPLACFYLWERVAMLLIVN